jgi:ABC-2 family transporter protein
MNQLIWRLHYRQVYWALGALAVLAVVLVITGISMANDYHSFEATCAATQSCGDAANLLFKGDGFIIDLVNLTLVIPALFGIFWGAPLLAKEYEEGTQNLAWTQGVTRRTWFSMNLLWVFTAAVLWAGVLTILVSWWRSPENAIGSRFTAFDIQGIVPIAYATFAVSLGIAVGTIVRRVLPAIATTIGGFLAVRLPIEMWARPHFMPAISTLYPLGSQANGPTGAWILSGQLVGPNGTSLGNGIKAFALPQQCGPAFSGSKTASVQCLAAHGYHQLLTYQPASRFWAFQGIEAAIFVGLAVVLLAVAYRFVLKRDA